MQAMPHTYRVSASAESDGHVSLKAEGLPEISSAAPATFDGPGDKWSPEELLVSAVVDCFVLTFRAIAQASRLEWEELECQASGVLDQVDRQMKFTAFTINAKLTLEDDALADKAARLLEKAEQNCLITNSLNAAVHLETEVVSA